MFFSYKMSMRSIIVLFPRYECKSCNRKFSQRGALVVHQKNPKACPGKLFGDQAVEGKAPDPGALKQVSQVSGAENFS